MHNHAQNFDDSINIDTLLDELGQHPIYRAIDDKTKLQIFMEHHVFAVWDFMSLIKALQQHLTPTKIPWTPPKNPYFVKFINQLVLEEESDDKLNTDGTPLSHFECYVKAMLEIGADTAPINEFVSSTDKYGLESAMNNKNIPSPAKKFMRFTFEIIASNQPHLLATALAYGRETVVPLLFRSIQHNLPISVSDGPNLHVYLDRHVQLDEQEHGPMMVHMVRDLCAGSARRQSESVAIRQQALATRLVFWDEIYHAMNAAR